MGIRTAEEIAALLAGFEVGGELAEFSPWPGGHIHESYCVAVWDAAGLRRYLLQRINTRVFRDVGALMGNIERVTTYLARVVRGEHPEDWQRRVLRFAAARGGGLCTRDAAGETWRLCQFVEGTRSRESVRGVEDCHTAGRAFGTFHRLLAGFDAAGLVETIPHFHDTQRRVRDFERAVSEDRAGRALQIADEIAFVRTRGGRAGVLEELRERGALPVRVAHNDAKLSNVLLDEHNGEALCVVDLDTVMPGLSLHDVGDMIRSMSCPAAEDAEDPSCVAVDPAFVRALAAGYFEAAGGVLTTAEREHFVTAGWVITFEQGVRFLGDYLDGDVYYRTSRPGQNLSRARVQFALLGSLERLRGELERVVAAVWRART